MSKPRGHSDVASALRQRLDRLVVHMHEFLASQGDELAYASRLANQVLRSGGTIFTCGNGGSAAHAIHFEAELVGRYREERGPLPSIYLGLSPSSSTAIANDYAAEEIFARPLRTLGSKDDLLLAFSTSGTSGNVTAALETARGLGLKSVLVSGPGAPDSADVVLRFPGASADAIQDGHDLILHALMDMIDAEFVPGS